MKKRKRILVLILTITMVLNLITPFAVVVTKGKEKEQRTESVGSKYESSRLRVTFRLDEQWQNGYNAYVEIENISNKVIHDWCISFEYGKVISNIWNAEIFSYKDGKYIIKNAGWNQDIQMGHNICFGFSATGKFIRYPEKYEIVNTSELNASDLFDIQYHVDCDWKSGFQGKISITNKSNKTLEDWVLEFDLKRSITNIWNAVEESRDGEHYIFGNLEYNSNIKPGETISFGFIGENGNELDKPQNYKLYSYKIVTDHVVEFDGCDAKAINVPLVQNVMDGDFAERPVNPKREGYTFMGWYTDKKYSHYFEFDNTAITNDITLYARWLNIFDKNDSDEDSICDSIEDYIGTDKKRKDTDEDGVSDSTEINDLNTDPRIKDTDKNGINDGDEDFDKDGLNNHEEEVTETNPNNADTDKDGIKDKEEIEKYNIDPNKEDSDDDGLLDGDEISLELNPSKKDSDGNGILDCDEVIKQKLENKIVDSEKNEIESVSIQLECSGLIDNNVSIEDMYNVDKLSSNVVGLVGVPVSIESDVKFDKAEITFKYNEDKLGNTKEENLCMMWYDEENDKYNLLEESSVNIKNNTISYNTTHFSTYLVVDKKIWERTLRKNAEDNYQLIQEIQNNMGNSSIYKCYENGMTWDEAEAYCEQKGGHLVTITSFDEQAVVYSLMKSEGTKNNYWIGADKSDGSGEYKWLTGEKMTYTNYKGGYTDNYCNQEDALMMYRNDNPRIGGYCSGYWNDLNRNGTCMGESFFGLNNMGFICEWDNVNTDDTDKDGIMDIMEEEYMLSNGQIIHSNPNISDTDGDGASDGVEMGKKAEISTVSTLNDEYVILVWHAISDPTKKDTDGDGLYDNTQRMVDNKVVAPVDPNPWKEDGQKGMWNTHVMQQEIGAVSKTYVDINTELDNTTMLVDKLAKIIRTGAEKEGINISDDEELGEALVGALLIIKDCIKKYNEVPIDDIRSLAFVIKSKGNGKLATEIGTYILDFVQDENKIAYHSKPHTWQRNFGYNNFYDEIFDIASNMKKLYFDFNVGSDKYKLWMWKGDYWNIHSGAEIGIYKYSNIYGETEQYKAIDFEVPMTLSLYNYYGEDDIDNIFSWSPVEEQWWITGFSGQNEKFLYPDPNVMVLVGSVKLPKEMYEGIKYNKNKQEKYNRYLTFDDKNKMVWIMWDREI